jgi:putative Ca2+/H+ antiporter (TMEM165/GDT1 family)
MDLRLFLTVFATVFVAEIGDKTQLATVLYAADPSASRWGVFLAAASALVLAAGIGVLAGGVISRNVDPNVLRWVAGLGFIAVGIWVLASRG